MGNAMHSLNATLNHEIDTDDNDGEPKLHPGTRVVLGGSPFASTDGNPNPTPYGMEGAWVRRVREAKAITCTRCLMCNRALSDAQSIAIGMGPDCREKAGYISGETRSTGEIARVNSAIATMALAKDRAELTGELIMWACAEIRAANMTDLADSIVENLTTIRITEQNGTLRTRSPRHPDFITGVKRMGARWDNDAKVWVVAVAKRNALWTLIKLCYPGALGIGPKGPFAAP